MANANPFRPFTPDPAQMALEPAVSGNDINGLNDASPRRPRMVYGSSDLDRIPHGAALFQPDAWLRYLCRPVHVAVRWSI